MSAADSEGDELEMRLLLEAIHARYGYDLRGYAGASLQRRIRMALAKSGLPHLGEMQHRILHDRAFFSAVLDDLTVRVTEMFRDPDFYRAFRETVVPVLRTYPAIRIWHAGCATGEEVYACAIVLAEEGILDRVQLYATDLAPSALEQAKSGTYPAERVHLYSENYRAAGGTAELSDYYTEAYDGIAMKGALRRNIVFFHHNLVSDHVFGEMHAIFCRNVFLYFGPDLRDRVLEKFEQSLCRAGFLFLGMSERPGRAGHDERWSAFVPEQRIYRQRPRM